jgi:DNA topoisomerase-3
MKQMVDHLVYEVRTEKVRANISHVLAKKDKILISAEKNKGITSKRCPKCQKGSILKGKAAYGCSNYKNGCDFRLPFNFLDKKISENQFIRLLQKGCTVNLKGFKGKTGTTEGLIRFDDKFELVLEEKKEMKNQVPDKISCPKCKKGFIIKGKTAYGCSDYKNGCDFIFDFNKIRELSKGKKLTKELVYNLLKKYT